MNPRHPSHVSIQSAMYRDQRVWQWLGSKSTWWPPDYYDVREALQPPRRHQRLPDARRTVDMRIKYGETADMIRNASIILGFLFMHAYYAYNCNYPDSRAVSLVITTPFPVQLSDLELDWTSRSRAGRR